MDDARRINHGFETVSRGLSYLLITFATLRWGWEVGLIVFVTFVLGIVIAVARERQGKLIRRGR